MGTTGTCESIVNVKEIFLLDLYSVFIKYIYIAVYSIGSSLQHWTLSK